MACFLNLQTALLNVVANHFAWCHSAYHNYTEWRTTECHYAECRNLVELIGSPLTTKIGFG
jgi:hypothetical protein